MRLLGLPSTSRFAPSVWRIAGLAKDQVPPLRREAGPHKARVDKLLTAARTQHYFTAVSGFQWLRTDPTLNLDQITALQDAIGKMQARLAAQAQSGDKTAARHLQALQNEMDLKE